MPTELLNAAEVAKEFLGKAGYTFARLEEGKFDSAKDEWRLVFDVGVTQAKLKVVLVNAKSGQVSGVE